MASSTVLYERFIPADRADDVRPAGARGALTLTPYIASGIRAFSRSLVQAGQVSPAVTDPDDGHDRIDLVEARPLALLRPLGRSYAF